MLSSSQADPLLVAVTKELIYYGYSFMLIFGNIGNGLNVVLFLRKKLRTTSCNNSSAFSNLIALNVSIVPLLYMESQQIEETLLFCRLQGYIMNAALQMSRYLILMASFDRFALCSTNAYLRKFCNVHIARRYIIPSIILIWLIISLHVPIWITFEDNVCGFIGLVAKYEIIYSIIMIGIIPPGLMFLFSLLIFRNLKLRQRRRQIHPFIIGNSIPPINRNRYAQIRDQHVLAMLLVQVFAYVVSSTPYTVSMFYVVLTTNHDINTSHEYESIITFIVYITNMLRFICPFISFYLFILVSRLYRREMVLIVSSVYRQCIFFWKKTEDNIHHRHNGTFTRHVSPITGINHQQ
ncbi:unnamed protein product [Rotaria sp. Silwood2]|nr:unnamed protein product [Rotaria sp. Silwood2]CAF3109994.1 unnamed protein product [Rotaria sp. Silwood2]CAF4216983.1 unnamed protein product [Rotaria sp. Silwood2]CAF4570099.1 unnamed protein product [Rotaria sp. Silwood2]